MISHAHTQTQGAVKRHVVWVCEGPAQVPSATLSAHSHALSIPPWVISSHTLRWLSGAKHTGNYLPNSWVSHAKASQNLLRQLFILILMPAPFRSFSICVCLQNHICEFCLVHKHARRDQTKPYGKYVICRSQVLLLFLLLVPLWSYPWLSATCAFQLTITHQVGDFWRFPQRTVIG